MWFAFLTAWDLFRNQKLRFLLTVSGVVVGTGSLVVMASLLSVGKDVLRRSSAEATGDDVVTVQSDWDVVMDNPDARGVEQEDFHHLRDSTLLPDRSVTAEYGPENKRVVVDGDELTPFAMGIGPEVFEVRNLPVGRGRAFVEDEYRERRRVVIVGAQFHEGDIDPGDVIRVEGVPFVVVGVLAEKAEMGPGGSWSWNQRLLFPSTTWRTNFDSQGDPRTIAVRIRPPLTYDGPLKDFVLGARDLMDVVMAQDRTVKSWRFEGVSDASSTEALIFRTIEALLYLTTVFSMVVGGINIMNIMLVTVVERTREIGTRRALGASRADVMRQFVAETVMVAMIGSAIGLAGAFALVAAGSFALTQWVTEWPLRFEAWAVVGGVVFSCGIGLVFGLYPAWRASRLDPVEALRYE
ncbi:MAG: ABC transporter permease [Myxococcota bacterium]